MKTQIVIRMGAAHYDARITDKGQTSMFDLAAMTKGDRAKFRRLIVAAFEKMGHA